jgi:4-diphosphocytidyl-2-C-methyl-D-erythritol kinase
VNEHGLVARCPAKVNLALRVLDRRSDGYHELDTLFQAIDLWDSLEIRAAEGLGMTCDDPRLPTDGSNLVLRAAKLLRGRTGVSKGASFHLRKVIPARAGLGGGSSDAAAALLLCARFWELDCSRDDLRAIAAEIGSDVPFFLEGGTARGTGRGELIEALPPVRRLHLLLGCPPFGTSTAEVYKWASNRLTLPRDGVSLAIPTAHKWPGDNDFAFMVNDLEPVVFEVRPALRNFRDALLGAGAKAAMLSGSGSTVYGVFRGEDQVEAAVSRLGAMYEGWRLLPSRTVAAVAHVVERDDRSY